MAAAAGEGHSRGALQRGRHVPGCDSYRTLTPQAHHTHIMVGIPCTLSVHPVHVYTCAGWAGKAGGVHATPIAAPLQLLDAAATWLGLLKSAPTPTPMPTPSTTHRQLLPRHIHRGALLQLRPKHLCRPVLQLRRQQCVALSVALDRAGAFAACAGACATGAGAAVALPACASCGTLNKLTHQDAHVAPSARRALHAQLVVLQGFVGGQV